MPNEVEDTTGVTRGAQVMNPLWIISLFLGLAEVTVGVVATQSSGWIQGLLALFATLFPLGVATAFFMILWRRPYVLYAPGDFAPHTTVTSYVEAMTGNYQPTAAIEEVLQTALESAVSQVSKASTAQERSSAVDHALTAAKEDLARRTITIRLGYMLGLPEDVTPAVNIPVDETTTVQHLLNHIAARTGRMIHPHTYGRTWVLNSESTTYTGIGPDWAKAQGEAQDLRALTAADIALGSTLSIRLIRSQLVRRSPTDDPTLTLEGLPEFATRQELQAYLAEAKIMDLKSLAYSMGLRTGPVKKSHLIEMICEFVYHRRDSDAIFMKPAA